MNEKITQKIAKDLGIALVYRLRKISDEPMAIERKIQMTEDAFADYTAKRRALGIDAR